MFRLMFMMVVVCGFAVVAADYLSGKQKYSSASSSIENEQVLNVTPVVRKQTPKPVRLSGTERIARDQSGHYIAQFKLNNFRIEGLVDTGATSVAINETTARRAGIRLQKSDFIYQVNTANGTAKAAKATIDQVSIGSIRLRDVEAIVMEDKALNIVLIGMSFMNRLRGFEYKNENLVLRR